jgi:hypothetical protein
MATMTIRVTVQSGSFIWTRTAAVEGIEAVSLQTGTVGNADLGGSVSAGGKIGLYSYSGIAVAVVVNKAKGSIVKVNAYNVGDALIGSSVIPNYMPFIIYGGAGTGFTGALNSSASATDVPDEDLDYIKVAKYVGASLTDTLYGFKLIS